MHKRIVFVVGLLTATVIAAASLTPLGISIGAWQVTMTSSINGMPPHTSTYTSCVRPSDLTKYPFSDPKANCTWNVVSSTSSTMQANGTCMPPNMGTMQFAMQLTAADPQHVHGTGHLTANTPNGSVTGNYSGEGKWIGAACPASGQ
jgi:Protein of unknown function (DUF3617)